MRLLVIEIRLAQARYKSLTASLRKRFTAWTDTRFQLL